MEMSARRVLMERKYVVFKLDRERYGLPIEAVERILPTQEVTKVPRTPKMLIGVFDMRGSTLPAIDARLRFEMPEATDSRNFVVVQTQYGRCGLRVDMVDGIVSLDEDQIEDKHTLLERREDDFIRAIGKKGDQLTVLLEPDNLVPTNLRTKLAA